MTAISERKQRHTPRMGARPRWLATEVERLGALALAQVRAGSPVAEAARDVAATVKPKDPRWRWDEEQTIPAIIREVQHQLTEECEAAYAESINVPGQIGRLAWREQVGALLGVRASAVWMAAAKRAPVSIEAPVGARGGQRQGGGPRGRGPVDWDRAVVSRIPQVGREQAVKDADPVRILAGLVAAADALHASPLDDSNPRDQLTLDVIREDIAAALAAAATGGVRRGIAIAPHTILTAPDEKTPAAEAITLGAAAMRDLVHPVDVVIHVGGLLVQAGHPWPTLDAVTGPQLKDSFSAAKASDGQAFAELVVKAAGA